MALPNIASVLGARINGLYYDFTSIEFSCDGVGVQANVTEINYSVTMDPGVFRGTSAKPRGRTRGTLEAEADFTIYKEDFEALKAFLASQNKGGFMLGEFPSITVNYREQSALMPVTDTIMGARVIGLENSHSQGNEALVVKVNLSVMDIVFNQIPAVTNTVAGGLAKLIP